MAADVPFSIDDDASFAIGGGSGSVFLATTADVSSSVAVSVNSSRFIISIVFIT